MEEMQHTYDYDSLPLCMQSFIDGDFVIKVERDAYAIIDEYETADKLRDLLNATGVTWYNAIGKKETILPTTLHVDDAKYVYFHKNMERCREGILTSYDDDERMVISAQDFINIFNEQTGVYHPLEINFSEFESILTGE